MKTRETGTRWKNCTLINLETGERRDYDTMAKASIGIGRHHSYVSFCIRKNRPISDADGFTYGAETTVRGRKTPVPKPKQENKTSSRVQLCCYCMKAYGGCAWSRRFEPVEGWTATPTVINATNRQGEYEVKSYKITACPEFERG